MLADGTLDEPVPALSNDNLGCDTCHADAGALRAPAEIAFPSGERSSVDGATAVCAQCHRGRSSGASVDEEITRAFAHDNASTTDKVSALIGVIIPHCEHRRSRYTLPFSRNEIASILGLSEETVCRQMAKFKRRGILYAPRGKIEILD